METTTQETKVEMGAQIENNAESNTFTIKTNLKNREEVFKIIVLAETMNLPLLFIGDPGVAKTASVRDYAHARIGSNSKLFILETDEFTRPSEIKGRPNMAKLVAEHPEYEVISPIKDADYIIINEIDKASSGMRNGFLSMMSEKELFNGMETVKLKYKLFVATCNSIPKEEKNSPFWDRFILKYIVNRMSEAQIFEYYNSGHREFRQEIKMSIPSKHELNNVKGISHSKIKIFINACYKHCSDRTFTYIPNMIKAVSCIWNCGIDAAMIKTAELLVDVSVATVLESMLTPVEVKNINNRIELLYGLTEINDIKKNCHEITVLIKNYRADNKLTDDRIQDIINDIFRVLEDKGYSQSAIKSFMNGI